MGGDGNNKHSNPIQSNFSNIADNFQLFRCLSVLPFLFTFELESFAYGLKDTVEDTKNQDKFTPEDRNTVLDAVREIEAFIQTNTMIFNRSVVQSCHVWVKVLVVVQLCRNLTSVDKRDQNHPNQRWKR